MLVGVAAGSSITVGEDGVMIGTQAIGPGNTDGRILASWDADGHALERIDTLGHVPDPVVNGTMTLSYGTPAALHFKVRDHVGVLNTMVLSTAGRVVTSLPLRPSDALFLPGGGGALHTVTGMPFLRFDGSAIRFALHGVPPWADDASVDIAVTTTNPSGSPNGLTTPMAVEFSSGGRVSGTIHIPCGKSGATAGFTHSTYGFRVGADGVRRPRCCPGFDGAGTNTVSLRLGGMMAPVDVIGALFTFHPH